MKTIPWNPFDSRRPYIKQAQKILRDSGIPLMKKVDQLKKAAGKNIDNMAWALNGKNGIHSTKYCRAVAKQLQDAWDTGGSGAVREALKDMRTILQLGKKFW